MYMRTLTILCFVIWGLITTPVLAQYDTSFFSNLNTGSFFNSEPSISLQPSNPQPGEEVVADLTFYGDEFYGSSLTWVLDGEEIPNSKNQLEVEFVAGENGVTQNIDVVMTKVSREKIVVNKKITPFWLDIIIEPQTHVPEFYQGRSLPSVKSSVVAKAILSNDTLDNSRLMYEWKINSDVIGNGAIKGQNTVIYKTPMGNQSILSVKISDLNGNIVASRAISIPSVKPKILFYKVNTLLGIKNKIINKTLSLTGNSIIVRAEPYYLDSQTYNNPDLYQWEINGKESDNTSQNPYEVVLEKTTSEGAASLQFHVRNTKEVLQGAKADIEINL